MAEKDALDAVVDYVTRHGDEAGNALREAVAEARKTKKEKESDSEDASNAAEGGENA